MKSWIKPAICLICLAGSVECWSQESSIVIAETTATAGGLKATVVNPPRNIPEKDLPVAPSVIGGSAGVSSTTVSSPRVTDKKYFLLNGLQTGMSVFDVEMTQHCIAAHKCREVNPVMPSSQAGQLGVNFAVAAFEGWSSYWLKKHHSSAWWVPLVTGTIVHSVGVATGFKHY